MWVVNFYVFLFGGSFSPQYFRNFWNTGFQFQIRDKEIKVLRGASYMFAVTTFSFMVTPFAVSLVTFATYVLMGNDLTAEKVTYLLLAIKKKKKTKKKNIKINNPHLL